MAVGAVPAAEVAPAPEAILVIGGGKMGTACMAGWIASSEVPSDVLGASSFAVIEPGEERRAFLTERYGVGCYESLEAWAEAVGNGSAARPDLVLLAVKPQVISSVLMEIAEVADAMGAPLFVSIAAGITTARLEGELPEGSRVIRTMPNMPLAIGKGAVAVCKGAVASEAECALVRGMFSCLGVARETDEALMDAVCAISGSGPAYVCQMIEALAKAGEAQGLSLELARELALQTVFGTSAYILESGMSVADVRTSICSPGGTTLAALAAMEKAGFDGALEAGVEACVRRSRELAG